MKTTVVSSKDLTSDCWSAKRFTGSCDTCIRVIKCKLPEAREGRLKIFKKRIKKLTLELKEVENQFWEENRK